MDETHRKHEPGNRFENAIRDYYVHLDALIGGLLAHADDDTLVLVVSDHGAKRLVGGIRINEWLRREGLLALEREPDGVMSRAGRRHRLVADDGLGRRRLLRAHLPQRRGPRAARAIVPAADYEHVRDDLAAGVSRRSPTRTASRSRRRSTSPEELYDEVEGVAPDLIVDLRRPPLALGRDDRRRRGHPHVRERHRPRRREPRAGRHVDRRRRRRRARAGRSTRTCSTSRRRCSTCSASVPEFADGAWRGRSRAAELAA